MQNVLWTKESIRKVMALWETKTMSELASELGVEKKHVAYLIGQLRKRGVNVSKKWKKGIISSLIDEIKAEGGR